MPGKVVGGGLLSQHQGGAEACRQGQDCLSFPLRGPLSGGPRLLWEVNQLWGDERVRTGPLSLFPMNPQPSPTQGPGLSPPP